MTEAQGWWSGRWCFGGGGGKRKGERGREEAEHARKLTVGSNRRGSGRREEIDARPELR